MANETEMSEAERLFVKRLNRYPRAAAKEDEIPTAAGLANSLGLSKEELFALSRSECEPLKRAYFRAMNKIEHLLLNGAAFKKLSPTVVNACLINLFGYGRQQPAAGDTEVCFTVEEG